MSEGYIIGGGGGSGGTLTVTGIAGSTVTVSKDGKTSSRTLDSTGKATFKGLSSGTWTVTTVNGAQTNTREVNIYADYTVNMGEYWLFNRGDQCEVNTGGWEAKALSYTNDYPALAPQIDITGEIATVELTTAMTTQWKSGIYVAKNKIDLTSCSTLEIMGRGEGTDVYCGAYLVALPSMSMWSEAPKVALNSSTIAKISLDVSNCFGDYYIAIGLHASSQGAVAYMQSLRAY